MHYVYLMKSESFPGERYVGCTADLRRRLRDHNSGHMKYTAKFRPWRIVTYVAFSEEQQAFEFERCLKSGSGHAFAARRLW